MGIFSIKRSTIAIVVLCMMLFGGTCAFVASYGLLYIRVAFADDQTQIFDEMRMQAIHSTAPSDIVGALAYTVYYCPSGTKQRAGSSLDQVVERHRIAVVRDIIAHLRSTTGEDMGENPEPWIQKYAKR